MSDRCRARVIRVKRDKRATVLATAAAIGDTALLVKDAGDLAFDDVNLGTLLVDDDAGTKLDYTDVAFVEDGDQGDLATPDLVQLTSPLTVAIDSGTTLWVYEQPDDDSDDGIVSDWIAFCIPEDEEDAAEAGEPLRATVPPDKRDDLEVGRQPDPGIPVVLEFDDDTDEWVVVRFRGGKRGIAFEDGDGYTLTTADIAAGSATFVLSHKPIRESLTATLGDLPQPPSEFTIDYTSWRITWPLTGGERAGDVISVHYAYRLGIGVPRVDPLVLPFQSTGWKYLQVARTDSTNRAGTSFDDSSWSTGAAAFGTGVSTGWPVVSTAWATVTALWVRRTVTVDAGTDLTLSIRLDDQADVYWNGTLVGSVGSVSPGYHGTATLTIPGASVLASNVLAVRAADRNGADVSGNVTYFDIEITR